MTFTLTSPAFGPGEQIPARHTADGADLSPPLEWSDLPRGTRELALIVDDPDAPGASAWVHWLIYKIPADVTSLPEGIPTEPLPAKPVGVRQGANGWNEVGYRGPDPPAGSGPHHYTFRLYALDTELTISPGISKRDLRTAMERHILGKAELIGTYER